jgi:hypothetical protein
MVLTCVGHSLSAHMAGWLAVGTEQCPLPSRSLQVSVPTEYAKDYFESQTTRGRHPDTNPPMQTLIGEHKSS